MASVPDVPARPPRRLVRVEGDRGPSLAEKLSLELGRLSHGTLIHRLRLRGRFPAQLHGRPIDPFPGDAARGRAILSARAHGRGPMGAPPEQWIADTHRFDWLRDVAAADPHGLRAQ
ncbi:MAG: heparinase, partial [Sphingomonadaceae bacterium]